MDAIKIQTPEYRVNHYAIVPEGLVDRPVPADEGHWCEEDEPEDGQAEFDSVRWVCAEVSKTGQHVEEQSGAVD